MTVIDRFEGSYAVIENEDGTSVIPRSELPAEAAEGDVLELRDGKYTLNKRAAVLRRRQARRKLGRLLGK
ncbi:MAG: DUF3006 domain-containing protein [Ruminococcus sp.]|nr:DUF3006 domain-containing protein [Ruminococcus sp.]